MRRDDVLQFVLASAQTPDTQGVTAQVVADALGIWRNDAAVELNKLVAEGKLRREGKKNVRFFPISAEETQKPAAEEPAAQDVPAETQAEAGVGSDPKQYRAFSGLVGADGSLKYQLRVAMAAVAYPPNGLNMLITGSTGSGKSHFARTIWEYAKETGALCGAHGQIPFVEFNCAEYADNPQLLLSHLFGYKKGAFTGALEDKPGLVEQADGGILFLDEIHCLSSTGQEMFFSLLDSVLFPGSIGICSEFLSRASYAFNHVYPPIAATLLAMHISAVHEGFSRDVQGCRRSTLGKACHDGFANCQFLRCEG